MAGNWPLCGRAKTTGAADDTLHPVARGQEGAGERTITGLGEPPELIPTHGLWSRGLQRHGTEP